MYKSLLGDLFVERLALRRRLEQYTLLFFRKKKLGNTCYFISYSLFKIRGDFIQFKAWMWTNLWNLVLDHCIKQVIIWRQILKDYYILSSLNKKGTQTKLFEDSNVSLSCLAKLFMAMAFRTSGLRHRC